MAHRIEFRLGKCRILPACACRAGAVINLARGEGAVRIDGHASSGMKSEHTATLERHGRISPLAVCSDVVEKHEANQSDRSAVAELQKEMNMAKQLKININEASMDDLTRIPGVDVGVAKAIIEFRNSHGRIDDLEELEDMEPIQPEDIDNLRDWVTVGSEAEEEELEEEEEEW